MQTTMTFLTFLFNFFVYAIEIFLAVALVALGMVTVNTPFSRVAFAFSWSRPDLKVNVREKDPTVLSEIQYLGVAG